MIRNRFSVATILAICGLVIAGCETSNYDSLEVKSRLKVLEEKIAGGTKGAATPGAADSDGRIKSLEADIKNLKETIAALQLKFSAAEREKEAAVIDVLKSLEARWSTNGETGLVESVDLANCRNAIDHLQLLSKFSNLKILALKGSDLKPESFDELAKLVTLEHLEMDLAPLTIEALQKLQTLKNLKYLQAFRSDISDEGLEWVAKFSKLEQLRIGQTRVGDAGVEKLVSLVSLKAIDLSDCNRVSDEGLAALANLPQLNFLKVWGPQITDVGMQAIGKMNKLRVLGLNDTAITDVGMAHLASLKELTEIHLFRTNVGDNGIAALATLKKLSNLDLRDTKISDIGVASIADNLPNVKILDLSETNRPGVTDASAPAFAKMKNLQDLNLWSTSVSDATVSALEKMDDLTRLNLDKTQITDLSVDVLTRMSKINWLHLGSTSIGDASAKKLAGLTNLKYLNVSHTKISEDAFFELYDILTALKCVVVGP